MFNKIYKSNLLFKKIAYSLLFMALTCALFSGCGKKQEDITIVYTNDVHGYIDNVVKDDDGNIIGDGLRYSKIAAMVNHLRDEGKNVILVDAGDEIQGDIYGALDEGETIIKLMNATGYQLAVPGNHEFDYGVLRFLALAEKADFPYLTCNFHPTDTNETILQKSKIIEIGGSKIAFIGITTPDAITSSSPVYFQNEKGEFIYTVDGVSSENDLYSSVQDAIDKVKNEADYVIAIGHVGIDEANQIKKNSSYDIIANVSGLDAFIDGHSHSLLEEEIVKDKDDNDVLLTQTGCYLKAVGQMTIHADGTISTKLVNEYDKEDKTVAALENQWINKVENELGEKIAHLDNKLYINNPDDDSQRLIRAMELNIGDLIADSYYWYFNENMKIECDITVQNGGGIRSFIDSGDITYRSVKEVAPFGNMICIISASGQQILDALEMGASVTSKWENGDEKPAEYGGFMQVAGLKYTIDSTIPSSVEVDENNMFDKVNGDYRVKDVEIYNRETNQYEPIDLDKKYTIGGINYTLRNGGDGFSMFNDCDLVADYVGQDYTIIADYIKAFKSVDGYPHINNSNSPLYSYKGYLLDYENPFGSGRITIK